MRKTSKRTTTRTRVKQQKKLREHNSKLRKEKRNNPNKFKKSKKVSSWYWDTSATLNFIL